MKDVIEDGMNVYCTKLDSVAILFHGFADSFGRLDVAFRTTGKTKTALFCTVVSGRTTTTMIIRTCLRPNLSASS